MNSSVRCLSVVCTLVGIFISLVIGAIIGFLYVSGVIAATANTLWIVIALALVLLFFILLALLLAALSVNSPLSDCLRRNAILLLVAIFGTIILALIITSVSALTLIAAAVLNGIAAFFITLMLLITISLACCILSVIRM